ncbi:beta-ketoacyl-[acyl-carrier-protein] synthase family protein [bacterium]|nr:beta-ketoacyl-[acyl-carrier-protein] synthase family protein [bacterium]
MTSCVVTGYSVVTPLGNKVSDVWDALASRHHAVKRLPYVDLPVKVAAYFDPDQYETYCNPFISKKNDRTTTLSLAAVSELMSGTEGLEPAGTGVIVGTGFGTVETVDRLLKSKYLNGSRFPPYSITSSMGNSTVAQLSIQFGFKRFNTTLYTACSAGTNAIGLAYRLIKHGYEKAIVVVGVESAVSANVLESWASLRAASTVDDPDLACAPFSIHRKGLVAGEGVGAILLESRESAATGHRPMLAEIKGYATNCDGVHLTQADAQSQCAVIREALSDAEIASHDVDLVSSHGTSTPVGDKCEADVIRQIFDKRGGVVPVNALKSQFGHTIGASGVLDTIFSIEMMQRGMILPTIHYEPDPELEINVVSELTSASLSCILKNSFGFGGNNAALVIQKAGGSV